MQEPTQTNTLNISSISCLLLSGAITISDHYTMNNPSNILLVINLVIFTFAPIIISWVLSKPHFNRKFDDFYYKSSSFWYGLVIFILGIGHSFTVIPQRLPQYYVHVALTCIVIPALVMAINSFLQKANQKLNFYDSKDNIALKYLDGGTCFYSSIILAKIYVSQVAHEYKAPICTILYTLFLTLSVYFCLKPLLAYLGAICHYAKMFRNQTESPEIAARRSSTKLKDIFPFKFTIFFIIVLFFWELYLALFREETGIKFFFCFATIILFVSTIVILYQTIILYNTVNTIFYALAVCIGMLINMIESIIVMIIGSGLHWMDLIIYLSFAFLCLIFLYFIFHVRFFENVFKKYLEDDPSVFFNKTESTEPFSK